MKKVISVLLLIIIISGLFCVPASAGFEPGFDVAAESVYMVNLDTGVVVYEKNAHQRRGTASLAKLMTSLLLMENVPDLEGTKITAPGYIYDEIVAEMPGSSTADIRPYEEISAQDLLYAMMLPSANEAASITADYIGKGNMQNFFAIMNARAVELGCTDTNFTSAHGYFGLDRNHYSSAYDMYLIAKACYDTEGFMDVVKTNTYWMPITNKHPNVIVAGGPEGKCQPIRTTNRMQQTSEAVYDPRIQGMKTGSTLDAGRNFISTATDGTNTYLLVVMGSPWEPAEDGYSQAFHVAKALYDWAFDNFSVAPVMDTTRPIEQVSLAYSSKQDVLKVYPQSNFMTLLPNGSDTTVVQKTFDLPKVVAAPIKKGDVIGTVTLTMSGEQMGKVLLIAGEDVERNNFLYYTDVVKQFFGSLYFKVIITLIIVFGGLYFGYAFIMYKRHEKMRKVTRNRRPRR